MSTDTMSISENISKNQTRRGRPRSRARKYVPHSMVDQSQCLRSQIDWVYHLHLIGAIRETPEDTQRAIWGCTADDITAGRHPLPKGFKTAAVSAGRWIDAGGDAQEAVEVILDARQRGISFGSIADHFRSLRIGERKGSTHALAVSIARLIDQYVRRFPATSTEQQREAVLMVLAGMTRGEHHDGQE